MNTAGLCRQLKAIKHRERLTYLDMAKALHVHEITVIRWCTGVKPPRGLSVLAIERFLKQHNGKA